MAKSMSVNSALIVTFDFFTCYKIAMIWWTGACSTGQVGHCKYGDFFGAYHGIAGGCLSVGILTYKYRLRMCNSSQQCEMCYGKGTGGGGGGGGGTL